MDDPGPRRAGLYASMALLGFGTLTALALVGWFHQSPVAWTWKSALALACSVLAITTSALVWRAPSRARVLVGVGVMLSSLARIGPPGEWTGESFTLVAITFVLLTPLIHASIVLRE